MENNETFQSGILPQENNILLGHEYAEKILFVGSFAVGGVYRYA